MNGVPRRISKLLHPKNTLAMSFKSFSDGLGDLGSGAGKGGGSGGSIREAGGAMGKRGAANEEEYFYVKQREQVEDIQKDILHRKQEIEKHIEEINKAKAKLDEQIKEK